MNDGTQMDMNLLNALFGTGWEKPENYFTPNEALPQVETAQPAQTEQAPVEAPAETPATRVAAYREMIAAADPTILDQQYAYGLHARPFSHRMEERFPGVDGMQVWRADGCYSGSAATNHEDWQALLAIRQQHPDLFKIIIARQSVRWDDMSGPFGNGWGE